MAKAVKLADIAEKLGVSVVTVSKALSGQKGVSDELRERIKELADELGYQYVTTVRPAGCYRSYNIGVLIAERYLDKYDCFYWQMYQQVAAKAVPKDCFTLMEIVTAKDEETMKLPRLIGEKKAEGIIVIGRLYEEYLKMLSQSTSLPIVYMDFCNEKQSTDAVISDSYYGAYQLTNYLFDMGHTQIAYVGTLLSTGSITDRYFGYVKSILEHGEQVRKEWRLDDRYTNTGIITEELMILPEEMPTAFFCNCDLTASVLVRKLKESGFRVPEDISVVGYDNYLFPGLCDVPLTTYEVDMKEMATQVLQILVKKMNRESYRQGIHIVEGHMVIKDSVRRGDQK